MKTMRIRRRNSGKGNDINDEKLQDQKKREMIEKKQKTISFGQKVHFTVAPPALPFSFCGDSMPPSPFGGSSPSNASVFFFFFKKKKGVCLINPGCFVFLTKHRNIFKSTYFSGSKDVKLQEERNFWFVVAQKTKNSKQNHQKLTGQKLLKKISIVQM